jgi:mono/diheme cytochrome c family protein
LRFVVSHGFVAALMSGLVPVLGCQHLAPSKPLNELTPQEAAGHQIFVSQCSRCHYANTEKGLNGPGLEGLFRKPYLPSGGAAKDARVTEVIVRGRNMMPALGNTLSDQQLEDLMAYLHTL